MDLLTTWWNTLCLWPSVFPLAWLNIVGGIFDVFSLWYWREDISTAYTHHLQAIIPSMDPCVKHVHRAVEYGYEAWLRWAPTQLFLPLVPVVQPDRVDSSCHKERGEFMAPRRPGSPHPPASIPLQKPLQRRVSVWPDSRQRCRITGITHNCSSNFNKYNSQTFPPWSLTATHSLRIGLYQADSFNLPLITFET